MGRELVKALGGRALVIRPGEKPLFHAACVFASNFLDVVLDGAVQICARLGWEPKTAFEVLEPMIRQSLANIRQVGTVQALSGPAERGDMGTVRAHQAALARQAPQLTRLYRELSRQARAIARQKKSAARST